MVDWGLTIWIYLWAAGMAGGAYFAGFLLNVFQGWKHRDLFRLAVVTGVPLAIIGALMLVIDLGTPIWAWHLFVRFLPVSVMSMGVWILTAWIVIAFVMMILWIVEWDAKRYPEKYSAGMVGFIKKLSGFLGWADFILAVLLMAYTGVLLASTAQALWGTTLLLPPLFVASAISTGLALLVLVGFAVNKMSSKISISPKVIESLAEADALVIIVELLILVGYAVWLAASGGAGSEAISLLISGELAVLFWVGFVLLALLIPFVLDIFNWGKRIEQKSVAWAVGLSALSVIIGGFVLSVVITIAGQL